METSDTPPYRLAEQESATRKQVAEDRAYLEVLLYLCNGFFTAATRAKQLFHTPAGGELWQGFCDLQTAVDFAANLSKMLWPRPYKEREKIAKARGTRLRHLLNLESDPVLRNRALRDALEHFDERVDDWTNDPEANGNFFFANAVPDSMWSGVATEKMFHRYDSTKRTFACLAQKVDMTELEASVTRLQGRVLGAIASANSRASVPLE